MCKNAIIFCAGCSLELEILRSLFATRLIKIMVCCWHVIWKTYLGAVYYWLVGCLRRFGWITKGLDQSMWPPRVSPQRYWLWKISWTWHLPLMVQKCTIFQSSLHSPPLNLSISEASIWGLIMIIWQLQRWTAWQSKW